SGKLISTYTYDPLIGVTSITPPSGVRQTYTYDPANRLKETGVRGKNSAGSYINKKVSENKYNYKP
ncbi:RHS repeat domain-containing protein, partial [Chryseobacterium sp. APV1]